jgi:hypothetical protein
VLGFFEFRFPAIRAAVPLITSAAREKPLLARHARATFKPVQLAVLNEPKHDVKYLTFD